jgi:hypothetical protein
MRRQVAILGKGLRTFTGKYSPQRRGEADKSSALHHAERERWHWERDGLIGKLKQGLIMRQHWSSFMCICIYVYIFTWL